MSELFSEGELAILAQSLDMQAGVLSSDKFYTSHNNHGMYQDFALFCYAHLVCQDNDLKAEYSALSKKRALNYWRSCYAKDGVHKEHSPSYANGVTAMLFSFCDLVGDSDADFCAEARAMGRGTKNLLASLTKPDGLIPSIGDSKPMPGEKDDAPIRVFPYGGYGILRSDDGNTWAMMSAATHSSVHKHGDDLQVLLYHGGDVLVEAGNRNYNYTDHLTAYSYSGYAHNVICIDNESFPVNIAKSGFQSVLDSAYKTHIVASVTNKAELAVTGCQCRFNGITQRRTLRLCRDGLRADITDVLTSDRNCKATFIWHLAPDISAIIRGNDNRLIDLLRGGRRIGTVRLSSQTVRIIDAGNSEGPYRTSLFNGEEKPIFSQVMLLEANLSVGESTYTVTFEFENEVTRACKANVSTKVATIQPRRFRMQIVSIWFLMFVGFAFLTYFVVPSRMRPWLLLAASIGFYSLFKVWALAFLFVSALSIWLGGLWLSRQKHVAILSLLVVFNIGVLVVVKYLKVAALAISEFGWCDEPTFSIIVPLGISFYTLQAVSYCWDVYRGTIPAEKNFFKLFLYLIFFPTIMQGPISRYTQLGDQLWTPHDFDYDRMKSGLQLMVWGFFKKMVIADRAALLVNSVFAADAKMEGFPVLLGVICYSIQIYTDFSGCVDICRGVSEVLGIDLIQNFQRPYFATSIKGFWRRWHISLSSWLKDYVYSPLGGNKLGSVRKYVNVLLVFAVSGIWHGEGINFFIWGLLHGLYQVLDGLTAKFRTKALDLLSVDAGTFSFRLGQRIMTFVLVSFAWIFFRAPTFADACSVIKRLFVWNPWTWTDGSYLKYGLDAKDLDVLIVSIAVLLGVSCLQERGKVREMLARQTLWFRWSVYLLGIGATLIFGIYGPGYAASQFIYMGF